MHTTHRGPANPTQQGIKASISTLTISIQGCIFCRYVRVVWRGLIGTIHGQAGHPRSSSKGDQLKSNKARKAHALDDPGTLELVITHRIGGWPRTHQKPGRCKEKSAAFEVSHPARVFFCGAGAKDSQPASGGAAGRKGCFLKRSVTHATQWLWNCHELSMQLSG